MAVALPCGTERRLCRRQVLRKLSEPASEESKEPETGEQEPALAQQQQQQQQQHQQQEEVTVLEPNSASPNPSLPPSI